MINAAGAGAPAAFFLKHCINRGAVPGNAGLPGHSSATTGVSPASSDFWLATGRRDAGAPKRFIVGRARHSVRAAIVVRTSGGLNRQNKNSRHGSEMGVFSQQLEIQGFKTPCKIFF